MALFLLGPEATTPPARGGEWSAEYRAGVKRIVEKRRERRRAKIEKYQRYQAFLEAQRQAEERQEQERINKWNKARGKRSGDDDK
jgi:hypothetical protein